MSHWFVSRSQSAVRFLSFPRAGTGTNNGNPDLVCNNKQWIDINKNHCLRTINNVRITTNRIERQTYS